MFGCFALWKYFSQIPFSLYTYTFSLRLFSYTTTLYSLYLGYSQSEPPEEDMRRCIQYPPNPKYPTSPPVLNRTQIAPYMQEGAKIQLFQNMNIQTTQFQPRTLQYPFGAPPPLPQSTAPSGYPRSSQMMYTPRAPPPAPGAVLVSSQPPHAAVTRHSSDPRTREFEAKSVISPLTQHTAVTRTTQQSCQRPSPAPQTDFSWRSRGRGGEGQVRSETCLGEAAAYPGDNSRVLGQRRYRPDTAQVGGEKGSVHCYSQTISW